MRASFHALVLFLVACGASAEVTVRDAWVRGTVAGQTASGAFMTITSTQDAKVVAASSPIAKSAEIHETMMMGGVNHMHPAEALALPAGKAVELKPGGHHLMLMGLAKPIAAGTKVPIVLVVEDRQGKRSKVEIAADVRALGK